MVIRRERACLAIGAVFILVVAGCGRPTYPTASLAGKTVETSRKTVPKGARPDPSHYDDLYVTDIDIEVTKDDADLRFELSRDRPKPR